MQRMTSSPYGCIDHIVEGQINIVAQPRRVTHIRFVHATGGPLVFLKLANESLCIY